MENEKEAVKRFGEFMAELEREVPRASWGPGPWQEEADRMEWRYRGMACLMVRSAVSGAWCGYVAVPPWHPWHGRHCDGVDVDVHGGLTYADKCGGHICHVPLPGEPADVWWLGFDCGHAFDLSPRMDALFRRRGLDRARRELSLAGTPFETKYRDAAYVKAEVERLADQVLEGAGIDHHLQQRPEAP